MKTLHSPKQNQLLAALPTADFERLVDHLELVPMALGRMLYEPGEPLSHAYFPTTSIVSLHDVTESGAKAETAGVGHEGIVGLSLVMGGDTSPNSAVVQTAGHAYQLARGILQREFSLGGPLQRLLLRYTQSLITQMTQTTVCNRNHSVEQQLCRWLLLTLDRLPELELVMTQDLVANMLGVQRDSLTEAAGNLQDTGYIRYRRGHISIMDRRGLESRACECYGVLRSELGRLLSNVRHGNLPAVAMTTSKTKSVNPETACASTPAPARTPPPRKRPAHPRGATHPWATGP